MNVDCLLGDEDAMEAEIIHIDQISPAGDGVYFQKIVDGDLLTLRKELEVIKRNEVSRAKKRQQDAEMNASRQQELDSQEPIKSKESFVDSITKMDTWKIVIIIIAAIITIYVVSKVISSRRSTFKPFSADQNLSFDGHLAMPHELTAHV